jgi:serine phosphatase RsbU (regulator of sigma subunit)
MMAAGAHGVDPQRAARTVRQEPARDNEEVRRPHAAAVGAEPETGVEREVTRQAQLIVRLRREAEAREGDVAALRGRLESVEDELQELRAIRDALTPPDLPERPGLELAAVFLPAAEHVSGDFYLVAEGPDDATVLAVGDVVGHGLKAARRAAFVRTVFVATAPFSDDPVRLLQWVNSALIERAGITSEFVTAACITYLPHEQSLRWAYAGHPPALWLDGGQELVARQQGSPLGINPDPGCVAGSHHSEAGEGVLLYTDGLTEARKGRRLFGREAVSAALGGLEGPSAAEAVAALSARVAAFASGALSDDFCILAARMGQPRP